MLHKHTADEKLLHVLKELMQLPSLQEFRLVGGTALSLLMGHRYSEDIDLFTHLPYGSVDFEKIKEEIKGKFAYVFDKRDLFPALKALKENVGVSLQVGNTDQTSIKVDLMNWSEPFINDYSVIEGVRIASVHDIALMKLEAISNGGRKKDFWDLSELIEHYELSDLLKSYQTKHPYHSVEDVKKGLKNFALADHMPDPICLRKKSWEQIKMEIKRQAAKLSNGPRKGKRL